MPERAILFFPGIDAALNGLLRLSQGPLVLFPPSSLTEDTLLMAAHRPHIHLARGMGRELGIDAETASDLPSDSVAVVASPSDPLGTLLSANEAVRLARAAALLIVDERHAEFAGQSLLALAGDFTNMVIVRTFETWAGLSDSPCAWAVVSPRLIQFGALHDERVPTEALGAALATLDNLPIMQATLRLLREERSRLFRQLRRLSFLEPAPSWGPFLSARVTVGERDRVVDELKARGVAVHAPRDPGLEQFIRFGLGSRSAMEHLRLALLDVAPVIVGEATSQAPAQGE